MSDLSVGNHADVVLSPGDVLRVSTGGVATVVVAYGAPAGTTTITANTQDFGPYSVPAKLAVNSVSGTASYSSVAAYPVVQNPDGKLYAGGTLVDGDGNLGVPGPTIVGLFGDSRLYYSHVTDGGTNGVTYPAQESPVNRDDISTNGVAHYLQIESGGAVVCPRAANFSVAQEKTDSMAARAGVAAAAMAALGVLDVVLLCSTNDRTIAPTLTATQSVTNIAAIIAAFRARRIRVRIVSETPRGDSTYTVYRLTDAQYRDHMTVRKAISAMHDGAGIFVVDVWADIANLASSTSDVRLGFTYDGIHPYGVMAHRIAKRAWASMSSVIRPYSHKPGGVRDIWDVANPTGSIMFNPNVTGTAGALGGVLGVLADAWTGGTAVANLTVTASKVLDTLGSDTQQFVIASSAAPAALSTIDLMRQDRTIGGQGLAVGGAVRVIAELEIEAGAVGIREIDVYVGSLAVAARAGSQAATASDTAMSTDAHSGIYYSQPMVIPAGATAVRCGVRAMFGGVVNTAATLRVKWVKLVHVT